MTASANNQENEMTFAPLFEITGRTAATGCRAVACAALLVAVPLAWAADNAKPQSPAANKQQREDRAKGLALGQETAPKR